MLLAAAILSSGPIVGNSGNEAQASRNAHGILYLRRCRGSGISRAGERAAAADEIDDVVQAIDQSLAKAGKAYREKKADEAASALAEARATFDKLSKKNTSPAVRAKLEAIQERLTAADRAIAKLKAPPPSAKDATKKKSERRSRRQRRRPRNRPGLASRPSRTPSDQALPPTSRNSDRQVR